MKKITLMTIGVFLIASTLFAYEGEELEAEAKINSVKAQGIAHRAFKGRIVEQKLEKGWYGLGDLTYCFTLKNGKKIQEVEVDAMSGEVLKNEPVD